MCFYEKQKKMKKTEIYKDILSKVIYDEIE